MPTTGALLWIRLFLTTVTMEMVICGFALVEVNPVLTRKLFVIKTILVFPSRSALLEQGQGTEPSMAKIILVFPSWPDLPEQGKGARLLTFKMILMLATRQAMAKMIPVPPSRPALLGQRKDAELLTVKIILVASCMRAESI